MTCAMEVNQIVIQILENVTNAVRMKTVRTAKRQFVKEKNAKKIQISGDLKTGRGAPLGRGRRISLAIGKRRQFSAFARQKQFTSTRSQHTRYNYNNNNCTSMSKLVKSLLQGDEGFVPILGRKVGHYQRQQEEEWELLLQGVASSPHYRSLDGVFVGTLN